MAFEINQLELEQNKLLCDLLRLDSDGLAQFRLLAGFVPTEKALDCQIWGDPDYESGLVLGAFVDGKLVGFCIAVRRPWKSGRETTGFIKWIYVSPELRRKTIGSQLLQQAESVMRSHGVTELIYGSSAPRYFWPGVAVQDQATQGLLDKQGWTHGSGRVNLALSLPATLLDVSIPPTDIETVLASLDECHDLKSFITANFTESWWWEVEPLFQPELAAFGIIARQKNEIIGFAAINATNPNWFGPMGVSPSHRGKGIGRQLLLESIKEASRRDLDHLTIPWVNEEFYNRCLGKLPRQIFIKQSKKLETACICGE